MIVVKISVPNGVLSFVKEHKFFLAMLLLAEMGGIGMIGFFALLTFLIPTDPGLVSTLPSFAAFYTITVAAIALSGRFLMWGVPVIVKHIRNNFKVVIEANPEGRQLLRKKKK